MYLWGITQMRERVPLQPVGAALEHEELRLECPEVRHYPRPRLRECLIARAGRKRDVELGTFGLASSRFVRVTGARVQEPPVLVDVREDQVRIVLVSVEHAVAMVDVDVDVGHAPHCIHRAQRLDHHA